MSEKRQPEDEQETLHNKRIRSSEVPWQDDHDVDFLEDQTDIDIKEHILNVHK